MHTCLLLPAGPSMRSRTGAPPPRLGNAGLRALSRLPAQPPFGRTLGATPRLRRWPHLRMAQKHSLEGQALLSACLHALSLIPFLPGPSDDV